MNIKRTADVPLNPVDMQGAEGCQVRWLVGKEDNAANFAMRQFELAPGGHTPKHFHPYEHEIFVLEGEGEILDGDTPRALRPGDVVYVSPDDVHQFRNTGSAPFKMLCLIPNAAYDLPVTAAPECGVEPGKK